jgi:hypothetical protein
MRINEKLQMDIPHNIYPLQINNFLFPILSDNAPIKMVVNVAEIALADTINDISSALAWNIL